MQNTIIERSKSCVIVTVIKGQTCAHFTGEYILQGVNSNVWFPISDDKNQLFQEIEKLLVINNIATNLTKLEVARKISDICTDYWIEYNKIIFPASELMINNTEADFYNINAYFLTVMCKKDKTMFRL